MSALPVPERQPENDRAVEKTALLVGALLSDAELQQKRHASQLRLQQALVEQAEEIPFYWTTADDREAYLRVYYRAGEQPDVLAAELVKLNGRKPTRREASELEDEFDAEFHAHGDLRARVISEIWDRGLNS